MRALARIRRPTSNTSTTWSGRPIALTVSVLPDPPVIENVVVRPDGMITIQLVGDVPAGGKTTEQIAADIQNRIARFKRGALVTVALAGAESSMVTVLGEVRSPTTFALTRQMRISEAIGTVGGPTLFANEDEMQLVRPGSPPKVIEVDLDAIRDGDLRTNVQVYGGDIIYVPPTVLARSATRSSRCCSRSRRSSASRARRPRAGARDLAAQGVSRSGLGPRCGGAAAGDGGR